MINSKEILNRIKLVTKYSSFSDPIFTHEPFSKELMLMIIKDCLDTAWVSSSGKWVSKFEDLIKKFTGSDYAIAVSNGTVALRLALHVIGVRENNEVLIPPLSFVATANAVSHLGAIPHFVDIEPYSLGMCPAALEKRLEQIGSMKNGKIYNKITGNLISAVVPVHVFGLPARIEEIKKVCSKWNLPLVEDAAEALGSKIKTEKRSIQLWMCG